MNAGSRAAPAMRIEAAREFREIARGFVASDDAVDFAVEQLAGAFAAVAARLLLLSTDPEASRRLVDAMLGARPPRVSMSLFSLLGTAAPVPANARRLVEAQRPLFRAPVLRGLLRRRTDEASALVDEIFAGGAADEIAVAARAVAAWGDPALLRSHLRPETALVLALDGNDDAVAWLERAAETDADACDALSQLARPAAVAAIARRLRGGDASALIAERVLGAMALGPLLLEIAGGAVAARDPYDDLQAMSLTAVADLLGDPSRNPLPAEAREPGTELDPDELPAAIAYYRERLAHFDLRLRYWSPPPNRVAVAARPVELSILVDALTDAGNPELAKTAAHQLRAMTGEDHGFDVDVDLIANLAAVDAWRARTTQPFAGTPGAWVWRGTVLAPPEFS